MTSPQTIYLCGPTASGKSSLAIALAQELLGWTPEVPLREGLSRTIAYFRGIK